MKRTYIALTSLFVLTSLYANTAPPPTVLQNAMQKMLTAIRALEPQATIHDKKEENLALVKQMHENGQIAREEIPPKLKQQPEKLVEYKNVMDEMLKDLDVLEKAIVQQESSLILASIAKVKELQKKGHTLFK